MTSGASRARIFPLYALSGFVSLGYQVAWFRIFTDWFGATGFTFALVVCNFIGGLGIGAFVSRRLASGLARRFGIRDRLRLYGLIELAVGLAALLTLLAELLPPDLWGGFPYRESGEGIWFPTLSYRMFQAALAAICVLLPCVFMGATFPLLCQAFVGTRGGGRFPSALYAWNTLGACTGVLVAQFFLIFSLGHHATFRWMVLLNLVLGIYFLWSGGEPEAAAEPAPSAPSPPGANAGSVGVLLTCAALGGLLAGALEGDLFKRIGFLLVPSPGATMAFISFWAILAIFVASSLVRWLGALTLRHVKGAFVLALVYGYVVWRFADELIYAIAGDPVPGRAHYFPTSLLDLFVFTGIFVFPPYLLVSTLLPWVCNRLQLQRRHLGPAYGINTVAFCAGMIGFTVLAPRVNIFYSLKLFFALAALLVAWLVLLAEGRPLRRWQPPVALVVLIVAALVTPAGFDRDFFPEGTRPAFKPVRAVMGDGTDTTFVVDLQNEDGGAHLFFGRLSMSGTNRYSQTYMRLMAHFPLLVHPRPERALLICFGVGNTASAIATHGGIRRIDAVDTNANIFRTAPEFERFNDGVSGDPRLRKIRDDGRNFLALTDQTYDLITSEPPPPMASGVYRLYSREYYRDALEHLGEDGLMTQWLPIYQMPKPAIEMAARTFVEVFPHTALFVGVEEELILIGSPAPIDTGRIARRFFEDPAVVEDLRRIGIRGPDDLIVRVILEDAELRARYAGARVLSDRHNDLEQLLYDPEDPLRGL